MLLPFVISRLEIFDMLSESLPFMIVSMESGEILWTSRPLEKLFGYLPNELLGQSVDVLVPTPLRHAHQQHRLTFESQPSARTMGARQTLHGQRKDGSRFPVEVGLNPGVQDGRRVVVSVVFDMTSRIGKDA